MQGGCRIATTLILSILASHVLIAGAFKEEDFKVRLDSLTENVS